MYEGTIQSEASGRFEIKVTSPEDHLLHVPTEMLPKGARIGSVVNIETGETGLTLTVSEPEE